MASFPVSNRLHIAVTVGDPAGIGPEVVAKALADPEVASLARWTLIDQPALAHVIPGKLNADCGSASLEYVRRAAEMCLRGEADAMVTAPINKEAVALSGRKYSGHTEYIAKLCGVDEPRMLLVNDRLRVIHVTT